MVGKTRKISILFTFMVTLLSTLCVNSVDAAKNESNIKEMSVMLDTIQSDSLEISETNSKISTEESYNLLKEHKNILDDYLNGSNNNQKNSLAKAVSTIVLDSDFVYSTHKTGIITIPFLLGNFGSKYEKYYVGIYNESYELVASKSDYFPTTSLTTNLSLTWDATNEPAGTYYVRFYSTYDKTFYDSYFPFTVEMDEDFNDEYFNTVLDGNQVAISNNLSNPLSAWKLTSGVHQMYSFYDPKPYEIRLEEMYIGSKAESIVKYENSFNDNAKSDQQWILMKYYIENNGNELLEASELLKDKYFYTNTGARMQVFDTASFSKDRRGLGIYDVDLYGGASGYCWIGILVPTSSGFPYLRISNGYTEETGDVYSWLDTDPNYMSITLNKSTLSLEKGKTYKLKATVNQLNPTTAKLIWKSNNEKVAKVDSKGQVTAVSSGTAIITVKSEDGSKVASCEVKVLNTLGTLKINSVTKNTTTIKGTGTKGAKVTAYVDGKSIGSATVANDGSYSIKISKQKVGKEITIKMTKSGYATKSEKTKVLNVLNDLKINSVTKNTTTIKGTGTKGAKVTAYVDGKSIGSATVANDGSYSIKILKQKVGKEITIKMTKSGYATKSEKTKVLNVFNDLKINSVTKNTTTIKGTGTKGAKVTAYVDGKSIGSATVANDGSYSIKISKQKVGKEITIKMTKSGYATKSEKTKVLNVFNDLKNNSVTKNTTTIKGTGTKGAKVTAYVDGKSIGSATVANDGSYSIKISKQKVGKEITIKMTKSGYASKSVKIKVKN